MFESFVTLFGTVTYISLILSLGRQKVDLWELEASLTYTVRQ